MRGAGGSVRWRALAGRVRSPAATQGRAARAHAGGQSSDRALRHVDARRRRLPSRGRGRRNGACPPMREGRGRGCDRAPGHAGRDLSPRGCRKAARGRGLETERRPRKREGRGGPCCDRAPGHAGRDLSPRGCRKAARGRGRETERRPCKRESRGGPCCDRAPGHADRDRKPQPPCRRRAREETKPRDARSLGSADLRSRVAAGRSGV